MRSAAVLTLAVCISNAEAATAVVGWGRNDFGQATMPGGAHESDCHFRGALPLSRDSVRWFGCRVGVELARPE
jgi:hypothetical protein